MKYQLAFLLFVLTTACIAQDSHPESEEPPNVLLVIVDDLGFADLGCLGSIDLKTPSLDKLFEQSLQFQRLYANCPVCSPTRASVLTGCYPDRVGVPGVIRTHSENSWGNFTPIAKTLPQHLAENGYFTSAIGKWHLGLTPEDHPMNHGFQSFQGFLGDMMDDYYNHRRHGNNYMREDHQVIEPKGHASDLFSTWACEWIKTRQTKYSEQPWFLYLAYNAPHTPIQPPTDWLKKVRERQPELNEKRAKLVALIEHMDHGIGQVLDSLSQHPSSRDTIIIFTSDNGGQIDVGANNGSLRDGKQSMYEGGLRIPGCIKVPGKTIPGTRSDAVCSTADFLPTILNLVGIEQETNIDGLSLKPLLEDPQHRWNDREIYFVRREGGARYAGLSIEALLLGNMKIVHNLPTQKFELYDLEQDPFETNDLSQKRPKEFAQMIRRIQFHVQRGGQIPWQ